MAVLICGGAGYIGSHNVRSFLNRGEDVVVVDNLWTGHRGAVPSFVPFYESDIRDADAMEKIFNAHPIEAVVHFCACSLVGESVKEPLKYFNNNVYGMQVLLEAMVRRGVDKIVFSSSAAVYGEPKRVPIREDDETVPTNPYGESKLMMEKMMHWVGQRHGIRSVSLRYFNVAGAWEDGSIGEDHRNETHLVPIILQVPLGKRDHITIFGDDYPTPDGTCIRDYINVVDLAKAHVIAVERMLQKKSKFNVETFNLGTGRGLSVLELVNTFQKVNGVKVPYRIVDRREGDIEQVWANPSHANNELGWKAVETVEETLRTSWKWELNLARRAKQ